MENRRHDQRYRFPAPERPTIRIQKVDGRSWIRAQLIDLGLGGMCVALETVASPFGLDDRVVVHLDLPHLPKPLTATCSVIYLERRGTELACGVQFLPLLVPAANEERDRLLNGFLMKEQRQQRKKRRGPEVRLKLFTGD